MKELDIITDLREFFSKLEGASLGIGDDCAYLEEFGLLVSTDTMVSGVHFLEDKVDFLLLGRKLISISLSDIASMGGVSTYASLNFNLPSGLSQKNLNLLTEGIKQVSEEASVKIIGGDTVRSSELSISATLLGKPTKKPIFRSETQSDSDIWVSGKLGLAALGLELELGKLGFDLTDKEKKLASKRFNDPKAQTSLGPALAEKELALSMIDISDGLLTDLEKLLATNKIGAVLEPELIPRAAPKDKTLSYALGGGEDYELLFTANQNKRSEIEKITPALSRIGQTTNSGQIELKLAGQDLSLEQAANNLGISIKKGFEHLF